MRIQRYRKDLNLSQSRFGQHIGVSFQQVQKYESGANRLPPERLKIAADLFGITVAALIDEAEGTAGLHKDFLDIYQRLGPKDRAVLLTVAGRLAELSVSTRRERTRIKKMPS